MFFLQPTASHISSSIMFVGQVLLANATCSSPIEELLHSRAFPSNIEAYSVCQCYLTTCVHAVCVQATRLRVLSVCVSVVRYIYRDRGRGIRPRPYSLLGELCLYRFYLSRCNRGHRLHTLLFSSECRKSTALTNAIPLAIVCM